jgi:hypothetical protein
VPSGDATSPATGSADSAEHAPTGRVVVDLLGIKEEPIDECMHTAADSKGEAWPCTKDLEVMIWEGNKYSEDSVGNLIQTLDSTLFQYNMRAWVDMQRYMLEKKGAFDFYYMNTSSGHRGFMLACKNCDKLAKISWKKNGRMGL